MQALNPYGTFVDIAVAMYETDLMQRRLAENYAKSWKKYNNRYEIEYKKDRNSDATKEYKELKDKSITHFVECMKRLGYKF